MPIDMHDRQSLRLPSAARKSLTAGLAFFACLSIGRIAIPNELSGLTTEEIASAEARTGLQTVDIPLDIRRLSTDVKALAVPVTVGRQSAHLHLDTGSSGLRILAQAVDPDGVIRTGQRLRGRFGDGTVFEGEIAIAPVSIGPIDTTEPIAIHLVDAIRCPQENPECFETYLQAGMSGILGVSMNARTGAGEGMEVYSPISRLPGNFDSGYIVRTGGFYSVDGILTVGLTPDNLANFQQMQVPQRAEPPSTFPDGSPIWDDDSLRFQYSLEGRGLPRSMKQIAGGTLIDSGSAHIVLAVSENPYYSVRLLPGTVLTVRTPAGLDWKVRSSNTRSLSQIFVRGMPRSPEQILGLPFFFNFEVAFNLADGTIGLKEIE